tara:strand:- start:5374 stop:5628 length:255 start_codon:yes stop_codon:yes gene_type:complete
MRLPKELLHNLSDLVNNPLWDGFNTFLRYQESVVNKHLRTASGDELIQLQGKARFIDELHALADIVANERNYYKQEEENARRTA